MSCHVMSSNLHPCMSCHVMSYHIMSSNLINIHVCHVVSCHLIYIYECHVMSSNIIYIHVCHATSSNIIYIHVCHAMSCPVRSPIWVTPRKITRTGRFTCVRTTGTSFTHGWRHWDAVSRLMCSDRSIGWETCSRTKVEKSRGADIPPDIFTPTNALQVFDILKR